MTSSIELGKEYIEIRTEKNVLVDLKYATKDNFMGENLYGNFKRCYLHHDAAQKFFKAMKILASSHPKWKFHIFDCLRPRRVQSKMWEKVKATPQKKYVSSPKKGSIHNFGFAIDLSLIDDKGNEADMGTPYDHFAPLAQPNLESKFLKKGKLTQRQVENRKILRRTMTQAGFIHLTVEWWHFDAFPPRQVRKKYKIIE